ncbi:hypothetical protein [Streptomyces odontomachi]|uniref:hypothetical protein n=1 Tax=Streptomyces odontomachi TaxID=2944940 RepID=UPI00210DE3E0|nr:hypothetical protein [Streptomyces sp. ODS25]
MQAKSDRARWAGVNATVTRAFVQKTAKEFGDLHTEAKSIWSILDDAHIELVGLQRQVRNLVANAREEGFSVVDHKDGTVRVSQVMNTVKLPTSGEKAKERAQWYADRITDLVGHATEVDASVVRALAASHGNDPYNAGHKAYTSLDEDLLPQALKLIALGGDITAQQRKELTWLWASLTPEGRAQLWATHCDALILAGVLSPTVYTGTNDDGAGRYNVSWPNPHDFLILEEAKAMVVGGYLRGYPDAARNMSHYLSGSGSPVQLDVDRMLNDDAALRQVAAGSIDSAQQEQWRRQALAAFAKSGGKPVAIPVQTAPKGYTHSDGNWYLAVGRANTNTTGTVTVTPGQDGKPHVSLDYQVNVWDRYNWDPGKHAPVGGMNISDADLARLHKTGLAREYSMRGSGSVQHVELTGGPPGGHPHDTTGRIPR